jgi:hypothetical protein
VESLSDVKCPASSHNSRAEIYAQPASVASITQPIWIVRQHFQYGISQPNPRPGINIPLSRRSKGEDLYLGHTNDETRRSVLALRLLSVASTRLSHSLFAKGCETGVTACRPTITNLPPVVRRISAGTRRSGTPDPHSFKFFDFKNTCRCDTSALTTPRQRCGG